MGKDKRKAKTITLILTVVVLAAAAGAIYYVTNRETGRERDSRTAGAEQEIGTATAVGTGTEDATASLSAESDDPEEVSSGVQTGSDTDPAEAETDIGAAADADTAAETVNDGFVLLDGGTVAIGSPEDERQRQEDETRHEVTLSPFYLDPFEVTQADYEAVMGENPSYFQGEDLPVDSVTWYDAIAYCNALSESRGLTPVYTIEGTTVSWDRSADGYRLPTEAEWEYAARGGTETVFVTGNQISSEYANFEGSYPYLIEENYVNHHDASVVVSENRGETIAVDSLDPNPFGLFQMYGNVSEWCFDYYGTYEESDSTDPDGPSSGTLRVNRGGGYNDFAKQLRSAYRSATTPDTTEQNLGFRVARNAQSGEGVVETTYALDIQTPENPRILVAYFSYSGNTENGAQILADYTGADLFEIRMEEPYAGNIYETSQADLNAGVHPALASHVEDLSQYDVVILGYPTWWSTMPMPVFSFLEEYDFSGKVILPFSSNGGTRFGDSISDLSKEVPGAYVGQGFEYEYSGGGGLSEELAEWLTSNGIEVR